MATIERTMHTIHNVINILPALTISDENQHIIILTPIDWISYFGIVKRNTLYIYATSWKLSVNTNIVFISRFNSRQGILV